MRINQEYILRYYVEDDALIVEMRDTVLMIFKGPDFDPEYIQQRLDDLWLEYDIPEQRPEIIECDGIHL